MKKRSKKLLDIGRSLSGNVRQGSKFFWLFFLSLASPVNPGIADERLDYKAIGHQTPQNAGLAFTKEWLQKVKILQSMPDLYDIDAVIKILGVKLSCFESDSVSDSFFPLDARLERVLVGLRCKTNANPKTGSGKIGAVSYDFSTAHGYDGTPPDLSYHMDVTYSGSPKKLSPSFLFTVIATWPLGCPTTDQYSSSMDSGWQYDHRLYPPTPTQDPMITSHYAMILSEEKIILSVEKARIPYFDLKDMIIGKVRFCNFFLRLSYNP